MTNSPRHTLADRLKNSRRHRNWVSQGNHNNSNTKSAETASSQEPPAADINQQQQSQSNNEQVPAAKPEVNSVESSPSPMEKPASSAPALKPVSTMSARSRAMELGRRRRQANRAQQAATAATETSDPLPTNEEMEEVQQPPVKVDDEEEEPKESEANNNHFTGSPRKSPTNSYQIATSPPNDPEMQTNYSSTQVPWPDEEENEAPRSPTNQYQMTASPPKMTQAPSSSPDKSRSYHSYVPEPQNSHSFEKSIASASASPSPPKATSPRQPFRKSPPPPPPPHVNKGVSQDEEQEEAAPPEQSHRPSSWTATASSSPHQRDQQKKNNYSVIRSPFLPKEDPPAASNHHNYSRSYKTPEKQHARSQQEPQPEQRRTPSPEAVRDAYGAIIETPKTSSVASLRQSFNARAKEPLMPMNSPDVRIRSSFSDVQSDVGSSTSSHVRYSYAVRQNWQGRPISSSPSQEYPATTPTKQNDDDRLVGNNVKSPTASIPWHKDGVDAEKGVDDDTKEPVGLSQAAMARQLLQNQLKSEPATTSNSSHMRTNPPKRVSAGNVLSRWQSRQEDAHASESIEEEERPKETIPTTQQHRSASPVIIPDKAHQYNPRPQSYRQQVARPYPQKKPEPLHSSNENDDDDDVPAGPIALPTNRPNDYDTSKPVILASKSASKQDDVVPGPFILPSKERPPTEDVPPEPAVLSSSTSQEYPSKNASSSGSTYLADNTRAGLDVAISGSSTIDSSAGIEEKYSPAEELLLTDSEEMDADYGLTEDQLLGTQKKESSDMVSNLQVQTELGSRSGDHQVIPATSSSPGKHSNLSPPKLSPSPRDSEAYKAAYFGEDTSPRRISASKEGQLDPPTAEMEYQQEITRRMYDMDVSGTPVNSRREHAESYVSDTEDEDEGTYSTQGQRNYPIIQTGTPGSSSQRSDLPRPYDQQRYAYSDDEDEPENPNSGAQSASQEVHRTAKTPGAQVIHYMAAGNAWVEGTASREEEEEADTFDEMDEWKDKDPDFFPELDDEDDDFHNDNLSPHSRGGGLNVNTSPYHARPAPVPRQSPTYSNPATPNSSSWRATNDVFQSSPAQATPEAERRSDRKSSSRRKKAREAFDPFGLEAEDKANVSEEMFANGMETFPTMESFSPPKFDDAASTPRSKVSFAASPQTYASNSPGWDDDDMEEI